MWKNKNMNVLVVLLLTLLVLEFPSTSSVMEEFSIEDYIDQIDHYPIIVSSEADKAVFIVPQKGCHVVADRHATKALIFQRKLNVYTENKETVDDIIVLCEKYQNSTIDGMELLDGIRNRAFLIYPGTKWCGAGNKATNNNELGVYRETDACCRDHDSCQDYIIGFTCHQSNGLCNKSPFTRSNCNCDDAFRQCLLNSNEPASRRIGILYFTVFGLQCFREDYPIVSCTQYGGFLKIHCQNYLLDTTQPRQYQFFDSQSYPK